MSYRIGLGFTPYTVQASSEHPEHPATFVTALRHPHRTWWSEIDDTTPSLTIDQGGTAAIAALHLDAANFTSALLETSPDGSAWTSYGTLTVPVNAQLDDAIWPRRNVCASLTSVSSRYLRLHPSGLVAGALQFELGVIALVPTLTPLVVNFNEGGGWTRFEKMTRVPYENDGSEDHLDGRPRMTVLFNGPWPIASRDTLRAILAVGKGRPFFIDENDGDPTQAYIVKRTNDVTVPREFKQINFVLELEQFA